MRQKILGAGAFSIILLFFSITFGDVPISMATFWQSTPKNVYSTGMTWRDCNNDGYIDLFVSNGNDMARASNHIYISNYGSLPTSPSWSSGNLEYSGHCAVGDMDDNGWPDFVVANYLGENRFSSKNFTNIYMNYTGSPHGMPDWYNADSIFSFSCALGEANGDGRLDLASAVGDAYYSQYQNNRVYYNIGGTLQILPGWQAADAAACMDVAWGDIDNDGDLDLAFCYDNRPTRIYYNNSGVIETTPGWEAAETEPANTVILGDVNNDGWLDVIVAFNNQLGGSGYYRVYFNDGAGLPNSSYGWQSGDGGYGSALALYDYDNDGDDDLAAGRWWDQPRIYENIGGTFTAAPVWRGGYATVVEELAWADVDGDGVEYRIDTIFVTEAKKVFYTEKHPLFAIDSVQVDGTTLTNSQYCYDLVPGWIALGEAPLSEVKIYYQYSFKNDLAVVNWDTYNMIYGNLNRPYVDFYADTVYGKAPLMVHFTDSSVGAGNYRWKFGDGGSSNQADPTYTFADGGAFDVSLQVDLADGTHNRTRHKMIVTLADTLYFPQTVFSGGDTIRVPIYLKNHHPMRSFILPIGCSGPLTLNYAGLSLDSCRTSYFSLVELTSISGQAEKLAFTFMAGTGNPDLPPGDGRILNILFVRESGSGLNTLDTTTYSPFTYALNAGYVVYQPDVVPGWISDNSLTRGDANHDGLINIRDITFLITFLYRDGPAPIFYEGDADGDGLINIRDITYLINFLYRDGPPPPAQR